MKNWPILILAFCLLASSSTFAQKQTIEVDDFESIGLGLPVTVYLMKGDHKLEIEGPASAIEKMDIKVKDNSLNIERDEQLKSWKEKDVVIYVTMPNVRSLAIGGSGDIIAKDDFDMGDLEISIGGSGSVKLQGGSAKNVEISIAGSGDVEASGLKANKCSVSIAGSGDVKVGDVQALDVSIAGSGDVGYKGDPKVSKSVVGSGNVKKM